MAEKYDFNTSSFSITSRLAEEVNNKTLKKFLLITNPFNSSFEEIVLGYSGSNGTFNNENGNLKKNVDLFDYEWVSNDMLNTTTTGKSMFDYDTSVRVVMLSVLLGLAVMIMNVIIIMFMITTIHDHDHCDPNVTLNRVGNCWQ